MKKNTDVSSVVQLQNSDHAPRQSRLGHPPKPGIRKWTMRVLIIEDDEKISGFVRKGLQEAGFAVDQASDGRSGLHLALTEPYDAAVIDLMLPQLDGLSVIQEMRRNQLQ